MIKSRYLQNFALFERRALITDAAGEETEQYQALFGRYVDLKPVSVDLQEDDEANHNVGRIQLDMRYSHEVEQNLKIGDRVTIRNKQYLITEIGDVFSRKKISVTVTAYE